LRGNPGFPEERLMEKRGQASFSVCSVPERIISFLQKKMPVPFFLQLWENAEYAISLKRV